jgi:hypothetical protein
MDSSRAEGACPRPTAANWRAGTGLVAVLLAAMLSLPAMADTLGTLPASPQGETAPAGSDDEPADTAPRSIVPPGFGATTPGGAETQPAAEPAQPAVQGTSTVIEAVPGSSKAGITMDTLGSVDASATGLIDDKQGSLGADMWRGASRSDVERYLAQLPVVTGSPVMNDLSRRLLLTGAQPPEGPKDGVSVLALRLNQLIAIGHADLAYDLGNSAQADKSTDVVMARARAALAIGKDGEACAELPDIPTGSDPAHDAAAAFNLKLSAFCQVVSGNKSTANLTLDLAREEGLDDPLFYSLVAQATDGLKLKAPDPKSLDILEVALYRLAGRELPKNAGEIAASAVVQTLARDEKLAPEIRIAAGERAAMLGLLKADELAALYKLPKFAEADFDGLKTGSFPANSAMRRALLFQAIDQEVSPVERANLIKLMLATGRTAGVYLVTVEALMPTLSSLTPSPVLRNVAPEAVRAFLTVGDRKNAEAWYALIAPEAGGSSIGRDARELSALMRISDPQGPGGNSDQISADILADLHSGVKAVQTFATLEAYLLKSLGYPVPQNVLAAITDMAPDSLIDQLRTAGQKNEIGEVVMLSLVAIGPGGPDSADPLVVAQAVSSLRAVHLDVEARRLATEALMGRSHAEPG